MDCTQTVGDERTAAAFKVDSSTLPVTLLIDKPGRIRFRHVGIVTKVVLEKEIGELLVERD